MSDKTQTFDVDLSNCDREPIHLLGQIQDFGFLVAVSMDWMIQHVSANIGAFCGKEADDVLGAPLATILPATSLHAIRGRLQLLAPNEGSERIFGVDLFQTGRAFDVAIHISDDSIVIEAEPSSQTEAINPGALVKSMISRIQRCEALPQLYNECVRQLRAITGFDRVMLYRFSETAPAPSSPRRSVARSSPSSASTIRPPTSPRRRARSTSATRSAIIADVDAAPVPVVPPTDPHGRRSTCRCRCCGRCRRSISSICKYGRVGLVLDFDRDRRQALGPVRAASLRARHLSMELRSTAELFGQMVSLVIEGRLAEEMRVAEETAHDLHDKVVGRLISTTPSIEELIDFAGDFREMIAADGFALWANGVARTVGTCPFPDDLPALSRFLNRAAASRVYATDNLSAVYPKAAEFRDRTAGLLAIPISRTPRDYLMFFRREIVQSVTWAGNPQKKEAVYGPNGPRLTPRKSFEAWQETVRGKSKAWSRSEMKAAEALAGHRSSKCSCASTRRTSAERAQATQRQELLIAELNHRVRNILSLMRALVVQSRAGARTVEEFSNIIGGRIQALARAHDQITDDNYAAQSLRTSSRPRSKPISAARPAASA